jgi:hypothetical protein
MNNKLIGISGKMGAGKDHFAKVFQLIIQNSLLSDEEIAKYSLLPVANESGWEVKKYAHKLKLITSILTGIAVDDLENPNIKNQSLGNMWDDMTVRKFLQLLGTDAIRNNLHYNTWINALFSDYTADSKWLITDVRFVNEYNAIKYYDGINIRIQSDYIHSRDGNHVLRNYTEQHESEVALDKHQFDYVIVHNDSLEVFVKNVRELMKKLNFI